MSTFLGTLIFVAFVIYLLSQKGKKTKQLKFQYDTAIASGNKSNALKAGRAYYSHLRGKKTLTIYDEQAISNDLSTM